jgi:DNA-binding MarR family transcriptional regulator
MSRPSLSEFAEQLSQIMPEIARGFSHRLGALNKNEITLQQFLILESLGRFGSLMMKELARFMRVTTAAMTGMVERLVREGYIVRESNPVDRRIIKVRLTSLGARLVNRINQEKRRSIMRIFAKISTEDRREYLRILLLIRAALEAGRKNLKQ